MRRIVVLVIFMLVVIAITSACDSTHTITGPSMCLIRDTTVGGKSYVGPCPTDTITVP